MKKFTKEDLKDSVEYKWRIYNRNFVLIIIGIINIIDFIINFCILIFNGIPISLDDLAFKAILNSFFICIIIFTICFLPIAIYYQLKAIYFLNNYQNFKCYEVILDNPSTSYTYRGAVYYTVVIDDGLNSKKVNTNHYFSSSIFSKFDLKDYNNEKVVGLYDKEKDKFYIVKKIN